MENVEPTPRDVASAEVLMDCLHAIRRHQVMWVAVSHLLQEPFTDAPDQNIWTRSVLPAIAEGRRATERVKALLG